MTPHFQRSVVAHLLPHAHGLPIVTPDIAGAGQLEWHAGLGETPLPRFSGGCPPNYHLSLNMDTHGVPVSRIVDSPQSLALHRGAGAVAGVVEALLWAETADHPAAGAVAGVVAALLWVETADHPRAGAVAGVVAALLGAGTAD